MIFRYWCTSRDIQRAAAELSHREYEGCHVLVLSLLITVRCAVKSPQEVECVRSYPPVTNGRFVPCAPLDLVRVKPWPMSKVGIEI